MREFFKGWKRKAGVVTLALACVFAAGWVRSRMEADWVLLFGRIVVVSGAQKLVIADRSQITILRIKSHSDTILSTEMLPRDPELFEWRSAEVVQRTERSAYTDIQFGNSERPEKNLWQIPYWSIVFPLTLLSAYLVFSKPRPKKPMAEPASTTGESRA